MPALKHATLFKADAGLAPAELNIARARLSSRQPDRMGDIIEPRGGRLDSYMSNPVVKFQHGRDAWIGDRVVGRMLDIVVSDTDLVGSWRWGNSTIAQEIAQDWRDGLYNTVSIGFVPIMREPLPGGGTRFLEWELMEVSVVDIPACTSCLALRCADGGGCACETRPPEFAALLPGIVEFIDARLRARLAEAKRLRPPQIVYADLIRRML